VSPEVAVVVIVFVVDSVIAADPVEVLLPACVVAAVTVEAGSADDTVDCVPASGVVARLQGAAFAVKGGP